MSVFHVVSGAVFLVDLAGRERTELSGVDKDGSIEAQNINADLLELHPILVAIKQKVRLWFITHQSNLNVLWHDLIIT